MRFVLLGVLLLASVIAQSRAVAQDDLPFVRPYDGIQAGLDAHHYGEARRLRNIDRQLNAIEQMRWWRGYADRYPPSLDYIYATGRHGRFGRYPTDDIFEPWPYVPGDIWGYDYDEAVRQPIGQRQVKTGPNRWESHPIYDDEPAVLPPEPLAPLELPRSRPREF